MRLLPHIVLGLVLVTPASALTPLPACSGVMINGTYETWYSQQRSNGFVTYVAHDNATKNVIVMLEHCKTGKALQADTFRNPEKSAAGDLDDVIEALDGYLDADRSYTLNGIKRGMEKKNLKVRRVRLKDESCACSVHFQDHRGARKPFR